MRLNKKNFPTYFALNDLRFLQIDNMFETLLDSEEKFADFITALKHIYLQVNKKYYITNTFKDAINTARPKIEDNNKQINEIPSDCGIIFTERGFNLYLSNPSDKKVKLVSYGFTRDALTTYAVLYNDNNFGGVACSLKDGKPYNDQDYLANYINGLLLSLYFIHNCEIEQKTLKPQDKYRENGNKHYNESNSDLIILDCKWFTELIRDAPFHVKGHLRWQVHGEKFSKRKLIWISDFDKSGYRRKATKSVSV